MADPRRKGAPPDEASGSGSAADCLGEPEGRAVSHYGTGDVIASKYELCEGIRRGGIGEVWVAHNRTLDLHVAIKLIRRERASPESARRLLQEARVVARLGHPSIVRVFDFGKTELGDPFLVMELLHGEPLDDVLNRRQRLPALNAVQLMLPVASALAAAHAKGIVHRDIKPDNIILVSDDSGAIVPKLLDFGIAKLKEEKRAPRITQEGVVLGSPAYMSPEQAVGDSTVDARSDIWSLCVVLYEAIAGHAPFRAANYRALVHRILTADPEPLTDLGVGDERLWEILERGLAKEKEARWTTMRELGRALTRWAIDRGADSDVAGTSLSMQWLSESIPPAPLPSESARLVLTPAELAAPGLLITDERDGPGGEIDQPSAGTPMRKIAAVVGAALLAVAVVWVIATTGDESRAPSPTDPAGSTLPEPPPVAAEPAPTAESPTAAASVAAPSSSALGSASASAAATGPPPAVRPKKATAPAKPRASAPPPDDGQPADPPPQDKEMPVPSVPDF